MNVVITGSEGQLGRALQIAFADQTVYARDVDELDVTRSDLVELLDPHKPELVIHAAAMTDVEGAARDPDAAFRINALATRNVALACRELGATMVYISTNEVFDGEANEPYREWDQRRAINPYGASKLAGERYVQQLLPAHFLVRPAWIFGPYGNNFVTKLIELSTQRDELEMVDDEISNPTSATDLAAAIRSVVDTKLYGTYHLVNEGPVSRFDYAAEILRLADRTVKLKPIKLEQYRRASRPPRNGALNNFVGREAGVVLRPWQEALADFVGTPAVR